ncbi:MAG TPA: DUF4870 domain-containing protein [Nocardioides sp.]
MSQSHDPTDPGSSHQPPQYGRPQYGRPQHGQPQHGQPQYGQPQYGQPSYAPQQQAISPDQERTWGAIAHGAALGAMLLSAGVLGFVGSLAIYLMYKDRGPFVRAHAANSLNVQITMLIWLVVSVPLILLLGLGILIMAVAPFVAGVLHVLGLVKSMNGEWWNPPLTPRFVR